MSDETAGMGMGIEREPAVQGAAPEAAAPVFLEPAALQRSLILLFSCLLLGILGDILFYGKSLGVSYPVFLALFYLIFFLHLKGRASDPKPLLLLYLFALAASFALHGNLPLLVLNFLIVPCLLIVHTVLAAGANRFPWHDIRFLLDILDRVLLRAIPNLITPFKVVQAGLRKSGGARRDAVARKVAAGLALSLPLLLVVVLLLASADAVFNHYLGRLPEIFSGTKVGETLSRVVLVLLAAVVSFAYLDSFRPSGQAAALPPAGPLQLKRTWDPLTVSTFLTALNLVYVFFAVIQFSYLFGGGMLALPPGFTYAEYARQGFFELLGVTVINFCVFVFIISFTARGRRVFHHLVRFLLSLLSASTLIMLASAFFRLSLYEEAYGFTYARVTAHAFMIYLFLLFLAATCRIWQERVSLLKVFVALTAALYLSLNYFGMDRFIAAANIDRYFETGKIDAVYLTRLSDDAVPQMIRLLDADDVELAQFIETDLYLRKMRLDTEGWPSFNLARWRAGSILQARF